MSQMNVFNHDDVFQLIFQELWNIVRSGNNIIALRGFMQLTQICRGVIISRNMWIYCFQTFGIQFPIGRISVRRIINLLIRELNLNFRVSHCMTILRELECGNIREDEELSFRYFGLYYCANDFLWFNISSLDPNIFSNIYNFLSSEQIETLEIARFSYEDEFLDDQTQTLMIPFLQVTQQSGSSLNFSWSFNYGTEELFYVTERYETERAIRLLLANGIYPQNNYDGSRLIF